MKWLHVVCVGLVSLHALCLIVAAASPLARSSQVVIDAAPSVVAHQGSSQAQARLLIAPVGRSLGFVQSAQLDSADLNSALQRSERLAGSLDALNISPIYVPQ